jgi:D-3-phosphoglycerate dehydrogenase
MTSGSVNFPIVELPVIKGAHRIVHIHKNVPGVLGEVNGIVSALGANIQAQFLSTDQNVGYLVMDMEHAVAPQVEEKLKKMNTTIKTRVLY